MLMITEKIFYLSQDGCTEITAYEFQPEKGPIKGIVQISHGMCEYIGRYLDFSEFLCSNGYIVCGNDHLGHGSTAKSKTDLGFFAPKNGYQFLVEDLYGLTKIMQRKYPDLKYFILGHSMGSFIARLYLSSYGSKIDAAIISGTSGGDISAGIAVLIAKTEQLLKGSRTPSLLLDKMAFSNYNKKIESPRTQKDWLTRDTLIVDKYINDPLCMFVFSSSAFADLFTLLRKITKRQWAESIRKDLPIFIFSGQQDPVGNYGSGVRKVNERLKKAGMEDVTLKIYPGGRHEMLNEINKQEVYSDILKYIEKYI